KPSERFLLFKLLPDCGEHGHVVPGPFDPARPDITELGHRVRRCPRVDFSLAVSSRLSERGDSEDHDSYGHDSVEQSVNRPGQVDVPGRRDFPVIEACNQLKRGVREDDISRRDDATRVPADVDHGGPVRVSIFNLERGGGVPEEIREIDVDRKSTRLNSSHEWISYAVF